MPRSTLPNQPTKGKGVGQHPQTRSTAYRTTDIKSTHEVRNYENPYIKLVRIF